MEISNQLKVHKKFNLKSKGRHKKYRYRYPFKNMNVGDSFFCSADSLTVINAASQHSHRHGGKFRIRKAEENDITGTRCWRIA